MTIQNIIDRIPQKWGKYVSIGEGWYGIVVELDQKLSEIDPNYEVHQVKEKFGGLRYYCSLSTDQASKLISDAEKKASVTCDVCGQPGSVKPGSFYVTCDVHK